MNPTPTIAALLLALVALPLQDPEPPAQPQQIPQDTEQGAEPSKFTQERLEQLVAPIALYPDELISQVLTASTYPLEIVQAHRWIRDNPGLSGAALEEALKTQGWDPSVKSLCGFPTVLEKMDADLNWTRDLGDAFLAQKAELLDAIQLMRKKASEAGHLTSTEQQTVVEQDDTVVIHSVSPQVIYVPTYSPLVVYGPGWYYPYWYYPYWYYPPPYGGGFVTFGLGFYWGSGCWSHCDWHHHTVVVDVVAYKSFHTRTSTTPVPSRFLSGATSGATSSASRVASRVEWTHDPSHRAGVAYRSPALERTFGAPSRATRPEGLRTPELDRRRSELDRPRPPVRAVPPSPQPRPIPPPGVRPEGPPRTRPTPPPSSPHPAPPREWRPPDRSGRSPGSNQARPEPGLQPRGRGLDSES